MLPELPETLQQLRCGFNQLTSLPSKLPRSILDLRCESNKLTCLPKLPNYITDLNCSDNLLVTIPELNDSLENVNCEYNQIESLPKLNKKLKRLYVTGNKISRLPELNDSLLYLYCCDNPIVILPILNKSLIKLCCDEYKLFYIIKEESYNLFGDIKQNINKRISTLNNFIKLFWCIKFKNKFRYWLWEKIRLPKIKEHYHPSKLLSLLNSLENEDEYLIDNAIMNW